MKKIRDKISIIEQDNSSFIIIPKYSFKSIIMFFFSILFMIGSIFLIAFDRDGMPFKIMIVLNFMILMGIAYIYIFYKTAFKRIIFNPDGLTFKHIFGHQIYLPYDQIINLSETGVGGFGRFVMFLLFKNKYEIFAKIEPLVNFPANKQIIKENAAIAVEYKHLSNSLIPQFAAVVVLWLLVAIYYRMERFDALPLFFVMMLPLSIYEHLKRRKIRKNFERTNWEDIRTSFNKSNGAK